MFIDGANEKDRTPLGVRCYCGSEVSIEQSNNNNGFRHADRRTNVALLKECVVL
jgi:hypothetical protein